MTSVWLDGAEPIDSDRFVPDVGYDDVIVGAGLTGLVTALLLAQAGRKVAVLEARRVGSVTTGNTTGKLSLLQGTRMSSILSAHSETVAAAYLDGSRAAMDWVLRYCQDHSVPVERRDAWTYAGTPAGAAIIEKEARAAQRLGLAVTQEDAGELPYVTYGAIRLRDQAQLYPMALLTSLAAEFRAAGGVLIEQCRVLQVRPGGRTSSVHTALGSLSCRQVVLATGIPIMDRGLYFAKLTPQRSYAQAFAVPGPVPAGMYLSVDNPTRSLRTAQHDGQELLIIGGNGHEVGQHSEPPTSLVADLTAWTAQRFPGAVPTHTWSAQDYQSPNYIPFVGPLPRGRGSVQVATGYGKWGMSSAPMAALMLAARILGTVEPRWAERLNTRVTKPAAALQVVRQNALVGLFATRGWLGAQLRPLGTAGQESQQGQEEAATDETQLAEGEGIVGIRNARPVAVSQLDGVRCEVSAVCTHLGGVVRWYDLERSWDCPLHGSRFAANGSVLEGPATRPLGSPPAAD